MISVFIIAITYNNVSIKAGYLIWKIIYYYTSEITIYKCSCIDELNYWTFCGSCVCKFSLFLLFLPIKTYHKNRLNWCVPWKILNLHWLHYHIFESLLVWMSQEITLRLGRFWDTSFVILSLRACWPASILCQYSFKFSFLHSHFC